jgi:hypothetical protein
MVVVGLIGGSGLLKTNLSQLKGLSEEVIATPHGHVFLRSGNLGEHKLVFIQRHDARPTRIYTQPADINYAAIALALQAKVRPLSRHAGVSSSRAGRHRHFCGSFALQSR